MSHQTAGERWVAGTDGCAADWMVSFARLNEGEASAEVRLRVLPRFAAILCGGEPPAMIAVDIPIGSPAQAGRGGPAAENMVRPLLGERQSSSFSVPFATATQLTVLKLRIEFGLRGIRYAREHEREQGIFWRRTAKHFGT